MKCSSALLLLSCCVIPGVAQDSSEPITVPEEAMQKLLMHTEKPVPPVEPGMQMQATVVFDAIINKAGGIESLQTVSGHPMLVPLALASAKQWRYRPYEVNGIPRAVGTTIRVEFSDPTEAGNETAAPESPMLVTAEDMRGRLLYKVAPVYPPLARQARIQGAVILRIIVDKLGEVRDTQLISGHPMLAPAAMEAIKKWRYMPYESDGKAVEIQTEVRVIFSMPGA